jgi:hypothetical protein
MTEGPLTRPLGHLSGSDDEPALLDGDLDALSWCEAGMLDPSAGELHPRIKRRLGALMRGLAYAGCEGNGERRLNVWVESGTALALARLARREGLTQRAMLERLVRAAEEQVLAGLDLGTPAWAEYFDTRVTQ